MSAPQTLLITLTGGGGTVTVSIAAALRTLEESGQNGWNATDTAVSNIFKRGYFWNDARTQAYGAAQIQSITYQ